MTTLHTAPDSFNAAKLIACDDGTFTVIFGYKDTTIRNHKNPIEMPRIIEGQFEVAREARERFFKSRAGADRAIAKWIGWGR